MSGRLVIAGPVEPAWQIDITRTGNKVPSRGLPSATVLLHAPLSTPEEAVTASSTRPLERKRRRKRTSSSH